MSEEWYEISPELPGKQGYLGGIMSDDENRSLRQRAQMKQVWKMTQQRTVSQTRRCTRTKTKPTMDDWENILRNDFYDVEDFLQPLSVHEHANTTSSNNNRLSSSHQTVTLTLIL